VTYPEMSVLSIYGFLTPYGGFYGHNIYTDMILDEYLSFEQKIYISLIFSALWIYFRTLGCYAALPRKSILPVFIVSFWMYANYYEPLSTPIGLIIMYMYSIIPGIKVKGIL
jgi:hypothetical protein